jgi:hypothetical protein
MVYAGLEILSRTSGDCFLQMFQSVHQKVKGEAIPVTDREGP